MTKSDPRRQALRRMQGLAGLLLLAAVGGLLLAHAMGKMGYWAWLGAFCEAAAVGALADWFAVVALFRRPLGLPIPHTAVLAQNKARVADSLANFVRDHFLDRTTLLRRLAVFDPGARLSDWLRETDRVGSWVDTARRWSHRSLQSMNDETLRATVIDAVLNKARAWDAAPATGALVGLLIDSRRHLDLLDAGLQQLSNVVVRDDVKAVVAELLLKHVRAEWPLMSGVVDKISSTAGMADHFAEKLSEAALGELRGILADPAHPLRLRYETWLADYGQRLQHDPEMSDALNRAKNMSLDSPWIRSELDALWRDTKAHVVSDLADPNSALASYLGQALSGFGAQLADDPRLREAINQHLASVAGELADSLRAGITEHISQTIKAWDDEQLAQELELSVGKDLQFIRISGTLVGGLAGLAIHAALVLAA